MSGADTYLKWCETARIPRGLYSIDACVADRQSQRLMHCLEQIGWNITAGPLSALVGLRSLLRAPAQRSSDSDFVRDWSRLSVAKTESVDINESRFIRWSKSPEWEEFIEHSITGARVILKNNGVVGLASFYRWVRLRADDQRSFVIRSATEFYGDQPGIRSRE